MKSTSSSRMKSASSSRIKSSSSGRITSSSSGRIKSSSSSRIKSSSSSGRIKSSSSSSRIKSASSSSRIAPASREPSVSSSRITPADPESSDPPRRPCFCSSLCRLFCCPPCPRRITEKLAFAPPLPPSYELAPIEHGGAGDMFLQLSPEVDARGFRSILQSKARLVRTDLGSDVAVVFIRCTPHQKATVLYSHGNAVDLGRIHRHCTELSLALSCDIVTYDYSGYGRSTGRPSEKNLYADVKAAWDYVRTFHQPNRKKIVLFGQSLGTAPTVDLASKVQCGGVVLQSPFISSMKVACSGRRFSRCMDQFRK